MDICANRSKAKLPQSPHTTLKAAISLTSPPPILQVNKATAKKITATISPHKLRASKFINAVRAIAPLIQFGISRVLMSITESIPSKIATKMNCNSAIIP